MNDAGQPVVYIIACGAPPTRDVAKLVDIAMNDGWDTCVITSPAGQQFIDANAIATKTGHGIRFEYKQPGTPDVLPAADAMIVAPATCNTMAKWAAGISDTLPLGLLVEAVGKHLPVVCMPFSNRAQLCFPAIQTAMKSLAHWGVTILGADIYNPTNQAPAANTFTYSHGSPHGRHCNNTLGSAGSPRIAPTTAPGREYS